MTTMNEINELLTKAKNLFSEVKAVYENPEATAEDLEAAGKKRDEAMTLKARAMNLQDVLSAAGDVAKRLESTQGEDKAKSGAPGKFGDWGEFLKAAWLANHKDAGVRRIDQRLAWFKEEPSPEEEKTMSGATGASGGFLIPPEFDATLQAAIGESSIVQPRATVIRMRRRQIQLPVLDQTGTTAGIPHWFGGLRFYYAEEGELKTESEAKFRDVTLTARKLIGYTTATDELVADSAISIGDFLSGPLGFAGGVAFMRDYMFLRGVGGGQPLGVLNAPATISVARASDNPIIGYGDLVNMLESFLPSARGVWVISHSALSDLLQLSGPTGNPSYLWGSAVTGVPNTLLGLPVIFTEKLPAVGTAGDVLLADFRYYLIGDRQATTIDSTQYDLWRYDKTSWRVVDRHDGRPWLSAPITFVNGITQVSPFVILGAKST
jgi:HK97 family phage major capsid protein